MRNRITLGGMKKITLADRIKAARAQSGYTQAQLAKKAGLSQSAISRVEGGVVQSPGVDVLLAIANALGLEVAALLPKRRRAA